MKPVTELQTFAKLKTDKEKWKYLISNAKTTKLRVFLDNDVTFVCDCTDEDNEQSETFDWYIGWSDGVQELLSAIGIPYECV